MRPGESLSLTVTLPNEQRIEISEVVIQRVRGQEFVLEKVKIDQHTQGMLQHFVKRLIQEPSEIICE